MAPHFHADEEHPDGGFVHAHEDDHAHPHDHAHTSAGAHAHE
jgi:urease accessory protein